MLKSENFLVRISKFSLRGYQTRQDTELPLKSQNFRSRLENTSKQRNRVQTQHRNAHPRLSKNSKTSSASLLKARNPSYFSVRKLQNTPRRCENSKTPPTPGGWALLTLESDGFFINFSPNEHKFMNKKRSFENFAKHPPPDFLR